MEPELNAGRVVPQNNLELFQAKCREAVDILRKTTGEKGVRNTEDRCLAFVVVIFRSYDSRGKVGEKHSTPLTKTALP